MPRNQLPSLPVTLSSAFSITSQRVDISTLIFHATSLSAAKTLELSTEPHHVRFLRDGEVSAILRFFHALDHPLTRPAIQSAVYLGRTRRNRLVGAAFSDEPCLYLVFPHMKDERDEHVQQLLKLVVVPAFEQALEEYQVPQIPGGVARASPPVFREDADHVGGMTRYYEVKAYRGEDWMVVENASVSESVEAARKQIHSLAWGFMQDIVKESGDARVSLFRDMKLVIVVPQVEHSVVTDFNRPLSGGGDFAFAVREALSLYEQDLDPEFLEGAKVLFAGEYDLVKPESHTMTTSRARTLSLRDFCK